MKHVHLAVIVSKRFFTRFVLSMNVNGGMLWKKKKKNSLTVSHHVLPFTHLLTYSYIYLLTF